MGAAGPARVRGGQPVRLRRVQNFPVHAEMGERCRVVPTWGADLRNQRDDTKVEQQSQHSYLVVGVSARNTGQEQAQAGAAAGAAAAADSGAAAGGAG